MTRPPVKLENDVEQYSCIADLNADCFANLTLRRSAWANQGFAADISLASSLMDFQVHLNGDSEVVASLPFPENGSSTDNIRQPDFRYSLPQAPKTLQWQVRPYRDGPLRYTLKEIDVSETSGDGPFPESGVIRAIYHHLGQGESLSQGRSEGVLLLPQAEAEDDPTTELAILASLFGLLWRQ
ncbi:hypothetical protein HIM_09536 [Hirsutella minnesotensis 3608]|uniref:Uncharacterized protein n=1 Tax=Hirsutella minnesotensis 3608 TaxID=1043627 RepID=A0A0F8A320_9HYPO|nr:hypothetical protein HIM_09536 [Hirsutella minnesotensis 3608]